jgi:hypothetical protein
MGASGPSGQGGGGSKASNKKAKADTQVSAYEREINKQKAKEKAQKESFAKFDKSNTNPNNNIQTKPKSTLQKIAEKSPVLNLLKNNPISKKTEEINRKFYKEKVVPAGKSKAPNYETYMKDRLAGKTDAYGNKTPNEGGGNDNKNNSMLTKSNQPKDSKVTTKPSEKDLTNPVEKTETKKKYDVRKTKKKGRRKNVLTSQQGVTKLSSDYSLSNKTLLGRTV